jgi:hypothetical protein
MREIVPRLSSPQLGVDQQFRDTMAQVENVRFRNSSVDSGTVHGLSLVHWAVLNPFLLGRLILFGFHERVTRREKSSSTQDLSRLTFVINRFVSDNFNAQVNGPDLLLSNSPGHSTIYSPPLFCQHAQSGRAPSKGGRITFSSRRRDQCSAVAIAKR